jgi:hypothetical protein
MSVGDPSSMRRATSFATKVLRTTVNATHVRKSVAKIRCLKCQTHPGTQESFLRSTLGLGDTLLMPNQPPFIGTSVPDLGNPFVALSSPAMNLTWGPSTSDLKDILRLDNQFPVIIVLSHPESTERLKLRVVAHDSPECSGYIAFSHVWSHGRGNPSINRMPLCQLERLARLASQGRKTTKSYGAFWIDTLCVPVTSKWARKKAIL